ncbi:MAG: beta strand repeat-containing protein, partial [Burkholderiales bacterium]
IGGAGDDLYVVDATADLIIENAGEGSDTVQASVDYTLSPNVEILDLLGSAISGIGNAGANVITGNTQDNLIDGGAGADILRGASGNDVYIVDSTDDVVDETAASSDAGGIDTVRASASFTLGAYVEHLNLIGNEALNATGNALANTLVGNIAANTLNGGAGIDTMLGGAGDDIYVVDVSGDVVFENANEGIDTVQSGVTRTLGVNEENLTLTGVTAINATGNSLDNVLRGNIAVNVLAGEVGNDSYYAGTGDSVIENIGSGTDTVFADVDWTLGANFENLTLIGAGDINATGNALANILIGNAGNNTLRGAAGADQMAGGAGNDTYIISGAGDVITEFANEGIDTVRSTISYTLGSHVENLTLTGSNSINGTGNALANILSGNVADNQLSGGQGDDIYIIDESDTVTESAGAGIDQVQIDSTYVLDANIEALLLTGTSAIDGRGNALNNLIVGNAAGNTLRGGTGSNGNDILQGMAGSDNLRDTSGNSLLDGGAGNDTLSGGPGNDLFAGGAGNDTITTGFGSDIIAFNRNDGQDTVNASTGADNTLSIGGGVTYADMGLSKSGNHLILKLGGADQITLREWYLGTTNKSVLTLQIAAETMAGFNPGSGNALFNEKVTQFNFLGLTNAFDQARAQTPGLTDWALTNAIASFQLAGSDTEALGGDLAYWYGKNGNFAGVGYQPAQETLGAANFGSGQQALHSAAEVQTGVVRLG